MDATQHVLMVNVYMYIVQVITESYRMTELYSGLALENVSDATQLRLLAQSIQLLQLLTNNASTAKQTCVRFLHILNKFDKWVHTLFVCLIQIINKLFFGCCSNGQKCSYN